MTPLIVDAAADGAPAQEASRPRIEVAKMFLVDVVLWLALLLLLMVITPQVPDVAVVVFCLVFGLAMTLWRVRRSYLLRDSGGIEIPYTCGYASAGERELFIVATLHISPRAPRDVEVMFERARPDMAMIELDEERLDDMRAPPPVRMQSLTVSAGGAPAMEMQAQRAVWNADRGGEVIAGTALFDEGNAYGFGDFGESVRGKIAVVRRGPRGAFAPFMLKAHKAARAGAIAVIVISEEGDVMPQQRIGIASLTVDLKVALRARNCSLPSIPLLLLPHEAGEPFFRTGGVHVDFTVLEDAYPRRSVSRRLCQTIALVASGLIVLYEIVECCSVEVGGEFSAAQVAAAAQRIPCECIDVDLDRLCSRIWLALRPTPRNILHAIMGWLAFPRLLLAACFPSITCVDTLGSSFLHVLSFRWRTWVAFGVAVLCASFIVNSVLLLFTSGAEGAAEGTGVVDKGDRENVQACILLAIEAYAIPLLYGAVSTSRDEAMYQSIVAQARERGARRLVAVVGAAHANGILSRVRERGL